MARLGQAKSVMDKYQVESDLRTLMEAEEIEKDPKRLKAAQALAKERMMSMVSVASESGDDKK